MSTQSTYDVAVIGAGVFGAWTAYHLQQSGQRVILIDAYGPGNSRSSSGGESRIIRMGYGADEIYTLSARRSLAQWQDLSAQVNEPLFWRTGVLWLAHENDPYPTQCAETLERAGIPVERLSLAEVELRYPRLATKGIAWALLEPNSGALLARRAVRAVVAAAIKCGVIYLQDSVVAGDADSSWDHIATAGGVKVSAGNYVFACGPWLPKLFPELLAKRICPSRQEVFFFGTGGDSQSLSPPRLPIWIDFKDEAYGFPDLESRGIKVAIDRHGGPIDPDIDDRIISSDGLAEVRRYLARRLPLLRDAPVVETRVCQYENTSSGDFLIDRHPGLRNVWLVGGGSGHGFKHGPVVGEYVREQLAGRGAAEPRFALSSKGVVQDRLVF
jgi:sarcosine oxidase